MAVPYEPVRWQVDSNAGIGEGGEEHLVKQVHVQTLINMYRVRGHLIAHLDPLDAEPPHIHPELDPLTYGLTIWDLPREFVADGLAGRDVATLDEILHVLRDAYCRTLGIEYMHIQDPEQKRWIQQHVEGQPSTLEPRGAAPHPRPPQRGRGLRALPAHPLRRAEALRPRGRRVDHRAARRPARLGRRRRHSRGRHGHGPPRPPQRARQHRRQVVPGDLRGVRGQPRPRVGPGLRRREVPQGRPRRLPRQRGRGAADHPRVQPLPPRGGRPRRRGHDAGQAGPALAADRRHARPRPPKAPTGSRACPSSCTAMRRSPGRAWWPRRSTSPGCRAIAPAARCTSSSTTSSASPRRRPRPAPRCTRPTSPRWSRRPIFHVNGDDPEACVRAARLAFAFRQTFHKDVVIDLVCYRKHGHNEGDDPSYTQPLMYQRIEAKRSVRKLYTETLVRRGDITLEEAESALDDFNAKLQTVLDEVRGEPSLAPTELPAAAGPGRWTPLPSRRASRPTCCAPCPRSCARCPTASPSTPSSLRQFAQRDELVAEWPGRLGARPSRWPSAR